MRYEIRALSASEILDTSFRILRDHFALLVGVTASVYVPVSLAGAAATAIVRRGPSGRSLLVLGAGGLAILTLITIAVTIVFAGITSAIAEIYCGRTITWRGVLARGQRDFGRLVGTTLLYGLLVLLGFLLLVVPGVYLMLSWALLWPVMLIERTFGSAALRRSRALMQGHRLRAVLLALLVWVVSGVLSTALALPLAAVPILQSLVSGVVNAVTATYGAAVFVLLYFDIRCRKEAFDLEHLAALVSAPADARPA
jgi:hypothetical protein